MARKQQAEARTLPWQTLPWYSRGGGAKLAMSLEIPKETLTFNRKDVDKMGLCLVPKIWGYLPVIYTSFQVSYIIPPWRARSGIGGKKRIYVPQRKTCQGVRQGDKCTDVLQWKNVPCIVNKICSMYCSVSVLGWIQKPRWKIWRAQDVSETAVCLCVGPSPPSTVEPLQGIREQQCRLFAGSPN